MMNNLLKNAQVVFLIHTERVYVFINMPLLLCIKYLKYVQLLCSSKGKLFFVTLNVQ